MSVCQIFNVDFRTKKVIDKSIGNEKIVYYRCVCCSQKYSHTKSDRLFVPSISWSVEQNKRQVDYSLCKYCISDMAEALSLIKEDEQ